MMYVFLDIFKTKNETILVVTTTGRGNNPKLVQLQPHTKHKIVG